MHKFFLILLVFSLVQCSSSEPEPMEEITPPTISIDPISVEEGNANKFIFVSIRLSKAAESDVSASVQSVDGSATGGEDFVAVDSKMVSIDAGSRRVDCRVEILGDSDFEEDETFVLRLSNVSGATILEGEATITIENDDEDTSIDIPTSGYSTPTAYAGMTLLWNDEFSGEILNEDDWTYEIGNGSNGWGNSELQFYRKENTFIKDGHLVIRAKEEKFNGFQYTSSRLITKDKFEFTHGRVDIRAALPEGQGLWPALWMLGANISEVGWPRCGEIDIMELVGHEPSTVHGTVHYPDPNGNRIFKGDEISLSNGKRFSDAFHVFTVIWEENRIEWYMDDQLFYTVTPSSLGSNNPYPFNNDFFFIFNVAVGGIWPGSPDASTRFPQNMIVDYMRVFQPE